MSVRDVLTTPPPPGSKQAVIDQSAELLSILELRQRQAGIEFYVPNKIQIQAHKCTAKTIVFSGGNRSGKSTYGAAELVMHLTMTYPEWYPEEKKYRRPIRAVISATSFSIVSRVIETKLVSLLPVGSYTLKRTPQGYLSFVKMTNGSTVDILTLEMDDTAYESADWDCAWLDEPQHRRKWIGLKRGLVDRGGRIMITMTPLTQPWMKEEIVDKADGKRIAVFTADIRDNMMTVDGKEILKEENIQEFEDSLPEEYKESRLHGAFFHMHGIIYKMFGDEHQKEFAYDKKSPVVCVLDPHDRLPHHLIWAWIDKNDDVWVDTEMIVHCELPDLAAKILSHEKSHGYKMRRRLIDPNFGRKPAAAGSNYSVIQELAKAGARFAEPCDDVELGHMVVREYLNYDRTKPVTAVNSPKLFFSRERVPVTIRSVRNLQYDEWQGKTKEDKNAKEVEKEKDNHGADVVRYLLIDRPVHARQNVEFQELTSAPY